MVSLNVLGTVALASGALLIAERVAPPGWRWPTFWMVTALVLFGGAALPLRFFLLSQQDEARRREQLLVDEAHRRDFGVLTPGGAVAKSVAFPFDLD